MRILATARVYVTLVVMRVTKEEKEKRKGGHKQTDKPSSQTPSGSTPDHACIRLPTRDSPRPRSLLLGDLWRDLRLGRGLLLRARARLGKPVPVALDVGTVPLSLVEALLGLAVGLIVGVGVRVSVVAFLGAVPAHVLVIADVDVHRAVVIADVATDEDVV